MAVKETEYDPSSGWLVVPYDEILTKQEKVPKIG